MEVAFDSRSLRVGGLDEPCSGRADLLELRLDIGRQAFVLNRKAKDRGRRGHQAGIFTQCLVMQHGRYGHPIAIELGHRAARRFDPGC